MKRGIGATTLVVIGALFVGFPPAERALAQSQTYHSPAPRSSPPRFYNVRAGNAIARLSAIYHVKITVGEGVNTDRRVTFSLADTSAAGADDAVFHLSHELDARVIRTRKQSPPWTVQYQIVPRGSQIVVGRVIGQTPDGQPITENPALPNVSTPRRYAHVRSSDQTVTKPATPNPTVAPIAPTTPTVTSGTPPPWWVYPNPYATVPTPQYFGYGPNGFWPGGYPYGASSGGYYPPSYVTPNGGVVVMPWNSPPIIIQ